MNEDKILIFQNALKDALKATEASLNKTEFLNAFKEVIAQVKKLEGELIKKIDGKIQETDNETQRMINAMEEMRQAFQTAIDETKKANDTTFAQIKLRAMTAMQEMFSKLDVQGAMDAMQAEHSAMMKECEAKMPDTEKMMTEMLAKVPKETPESIRDSLESLDGEEQLRIESIYKLREELDELKKKVGTRVGSVGGFNYGSLSMHLIDDETPVGDIDSVNTVFTINNPPSPVSSLKVYKGGSRMRITEDYTFSGVTLTFLVAPQTGEILLVDYRL